VSPVPRSRPDVRDDRGSLRAGLAGGLAGAALVLLLGAGPAGPLGSVGDGLGRAWHGLTGALVPDVRPGPPGPR
jgi:hypothetical protein